MISAIWGRLYLFNFKHAIVGIDTFIENIIFIRFIGVIKPVIQKWNTIFYNLPRR